ncbi:hypothetical protein PC112_g3227 [Phytophthora cactorum]|nr:hypothetical protein PC112_g3227 [Phytophthora cactorum]
MLPKLQRRAISVVLLLDVSTKLKQQWLDSPRKVTGCSVDALHIAPSAPLNLVSSDDGGDDTDQRALYVPNPPRIGDFARYSDQAAQSATTSGSANAFFSTEPAVIDLVSTDDSGEDAENTQIGSHVVTVSVGDHHGSHLGDAAEDGDGVMDAVKLEAGLEAMEAVNTILKRTDTYKDVAKRGKKMQSKNNPQQQPKSRRRRY